MAMKVSDEYTVPLCVGRHDSLHRTGDERAWWAARNIDALAVALRLWTAADKSLEHPTTVANVHGHESRNDTETTTPTGAPRQTTG